MMAGRVRKQVVDGALALIELYKNDKNFEQALKELRLVVEEATTSKDAAVSAMAEFETIRAEAETKRVEANIAEAAVKNERDIVGAEATASLAQIVERQERLEAREAAFKTRKEEEERHLRADREALEAREALFSEKETNLAAREQAVIDKAVRLEADQIAFNAKSAELNEFMNRFKS
jgi:hypothetical protein